MNKSQLRTIIKEEISKTLKEDDWPSLSSLASAVEEEENAYNIAVTIANNIDKYDITATSLGTEQKQKLNEIGVLGVAGGVALGLLGTLALVKGFKVAKNIGGFALYSLQDYIAKKKAAEEAAQELEDKKAILLPLVQKFENDETLKAMYAEVPPFQGGVSIRASKNNKLRTKQLTAVAKYIKSKLTKEEQWYFADLSKYLRDTAEYGSAEIRETKMKKLSIQEQITKLYQQGEEQELRKVIRKILKENLQEWEGMIETELNETLQDEIDEYRREGLSDDEIWHQLDARGIDSFVIDREMEKNLGSEF